MRKQRGEHVRVDRGRDGVATVRLARPEKLNALTLAMLDDLVRTARALRGDDTVRGVVLSGDGEAFCAGLDLRAALRDPSGIGTRFLPHPWRGTNTFQEACWAWRRLPVPVVAAVHGHCLGAGIQLALGADLRTTTPDASWSVREVRWGLVPDMGGVRSLAELVGVDVAKELTLSARSVSGEEAHALGLATRVGPDPATLARDLLAPMLEHDPQAVARAKRLVTSSWHRSPRGTFARERRAQLALLARLASSGLPGADAPRDPGSPGRVDTPGPVDDGGRA
ncbi:crotonase/enoyl-CoA hydratase family protein [Serinicoccus kebangsaanensis]|uniref:crotonase/enoyl-CoA hydratase family protein n=1 Tax=Serinicoccus kebangsaanensis TaxID=2602069 RepID=UPI00124E28BB|nr:crotonase/enoyl-CoA hydratase family protein [Serinicoccus kebangsaanensis]